MRWLAVGMVLPVLVACTREAPDSVVARIGAYSISTQDLRYRTAVARIYAPGDGETAAFLQLRRGFAYAQVLANLERPITEEALAKEERRIDETTLAPRTLAKIRNVFGEDEAAYRRVFVLPVLAERQLADEFQIDARVQLPQFRAATALRKRGTMRGHTVRRAHVSLREGLRFDDDDDGIRPVPPALSAPEERDFDGETVVAFTPDPRWWIHAALPLVRAGQFLPTVIEQSDAWLVVRYVGRDPRDRHSHRLELVSFPRPTFETWLKAELERVPGALS